MQNQLTSQQPPSIFNFDNSQIRTIMQNGEPWFVAKDITDALGYSNGRDAVSKHCKGNNTVAICDGTPGNPNTTIIPERDVYRLIVKSQLPSAERFEEWVFGEVLPSIRKTGGYHLPMSYGEALQQLAMEVGLREYNQPKVDFFNAVAESSDLILIREAAKTLAVPFLGQNTLYQILRNVKVLMESNEPYQKYCDKGYFMVRERQYTAKGESRISRTTMVTQVGLDFLRRLIVANMNGGRMTAPARWVLPSCKQKELLTN
jgi:anti-repressor protein